MRLFCKPGVYINSNFLPALLRRVVHWVEIAQAMLGFEKASPQRVELCLIGRWFVSVPRGF